MHVRLLVLRFKYLDLILLLSFVIFLYCRKSFPNCIAQMFLIHSSNDLMEILVMFHVSISFVSDVSPKMTIGKIKNTQKRVIC